MAENTAVQIWAYKPSDSATYLVERDEDEAYRKAAQHNAEAAEVARKATARHQAAENATAKREGRAARKVADVVPIEWTVHTAWKSEWTSNG